MRIRASATKGVGTQSTGTHLRQAAGLQRIPASASAQSNGQRFSLTLVIWTGEIDVDNNLGAELIDVVSRHELSTVATVDDIDRPATDSG